MKSNYENVKNVQIFDDYAHWAEDKDLDAALMDVARRCDLNGGNRLEFARQIKEGVKNCIKVSADVLVNTKQQTEAFFEKMSDRDLEERVIIKRHIALGLSCCMNDDALGLLDNGVTGNGLYYAHYSKVPEASEQEEKNLEQEIIQRITNFNLSPAALNRLLKKLGSATDYVATAAAFGREGYSLKCLYAAELYQANQESMTIEMAAADACTFVDMQAVADSVRLGLMTEAAAMVLLAGVMVASVLMAGQLMLAAGTIQAVAGIFAGTFLFILGVSAAASELSAEAGRLAVSTYHLARRGVETLKNGLQRLRDYLETPEDFYDDETDTDDDWEMERTLY